MSAPGRSQPKQTPTHGQVVLQESGDKGKPTEHNGNPSVKNSGTPTDNFQKSDGKQPSKSTESSKHPRLPKPPKSVTKRTDFKDLIKTESKDGKESSKLKEAGEFILDVADSTPPVGELYIVIKDQIQHFTISPLPADLRNPAYLADSIKKLFEGSNGFHKVVFKKDEKAKTYDLDTKRSEATKSKTDGNTKAFEAPKSAKEICTNFAKAFDPKSMPATVVVDNKAKLQFEPGARALTAISYRGYCVKDVKESDALRELVEGAPKDSAPSVLSKSFRPSNAFYQALAYSEGNQPIVELIPDSPCRPSESPSKDLKQYKIGLYLPEFKTKYEEEWEGAQGSLTISAKGYTCEAKDKKGQTQNYYSDLEESVNLDGKNDFRISYEEFVSIPQSQRVFLANGFPEDFYESFKERISNQQYGSIQHSTRPDGSVMTLQNILDSKDEKLNGLRGFLEDLSKPYFSSFYGFQSTKEFSALLPLTIPQLAAKIVRTEKYYCMTGADGKLRARDPDAKPADDLLLVSISPDSKSAKDTYKTMLQAVKHNATHDENGNTRTEKQWKGLPGENAPEAPLKAFVVIPVDSASGNVDDLVSAISEQSGGLDKIFITAKDTKKFEEALNKAKEVHANDPKMLFTLNNIIIMPNTNALHFAQQLKEQFPENVIGLVNYCKPDATLGNQIGGDINRIVDSGTLSSSSEEEIMAHGIMLPPNLSVNPLIKAAPVVKP